MKSSDRRLGPSQGLPMGLLCLALLLGALLRSAHEIAVPHRVCELHGTLEHGTLLHDGDEAAGDSAGVRFRPASTPHEECELAAFTRHEEAVRPEAPPAVDRIGGARLAVHAPRVPPPARPLFGRAPARSPPA